MVIISSQLADKHTFGYYVPNARLTDCIQTNLYIHNMVEQQRRVIHCQSEYVVM